MIFFVLTALFSSLVGGFLTIRQTEKVLLIDAEKFFSSISSQKINQLRLRFSDIQSRMAAFVEGNRDFIATITQYLKNPSSENKDFTYDYLNRFLFHNPIFFEALLFDPDAGTVFLSTDSSREDLDLSEYPYFKEGENKIFLSPVYYSPLLESHAMTISIPVKNDDGKLLAVLAARVNLLSFNDILSERSGMGLTGETYLVARDLYPITGLHYSASHSDYKAGPMITFGISEAFDGREGFATYDGYASYPVAGYYQYLPDLDAALLVEQHLDEMTEPIRKLQKKVLWSILFILFFVLIFAYLVALRIATPIVRLSEAAHSILVGKKVKMVSVESSDEIGMMADAFNQMTQYLTTSLAETQNIIKTIPEALFILDRDGRIRFANPAATGLTGISSFKLIGSPVDHLFHLTSSLFPRKTQSTSLAWFQQGPFSDLSAYCVLGRQIKIPVSLSAGPPLIDEKGDPKGFLVVAKDLREQKRYAKERVNEILPILQSVSLGDFSKAIELPDSEDEFTDLLVSVDMMSQNLKELIEENRRKAVEIQQSQEKLKFTNIKILKAKKEAEKEKARAETLLSSLGEGVLAIDLKGNMLLMNHAAEKMFGVSVEDMIGKPFFDFLSFKNKQGKKLQMGIYPITEAIRGKKPVYTILYFVKKDGTQVPLATTSSPILIGNKIIGIIGTFRDITKEMAVDQAKSEFVSLASHQLRTPLTGIKWLVQAALKKDAISPMQEDFLKDALQSNERMIMLVNNLLNVSRLETGSVSVTPQKIKLIDFLDKIVQDLHPVSVKRKQIIRFIKPKLDINIILDPQLISQVIINLLSNAMDYSDEKKTITLSTEKKGSKVIIQVRDEGMGISKQDQKKVFGKFFRSSEAVRRSTTGSGLGLYIVKAIIQASKGTIRCHSTEGKGTTFFITLPLKGPPARIGLKDLISQKFS